MSAISLSVQSAAASPFTGIATKVCGGCGETKRLDEFTTDKSSKDGKANGCKSCQSGRQRARRRGIECSYGSEFRVCKTCLEVKPLSSFTTDYRRPGKPLAKCRECVAATGSEWYQDNRETHDARCRRWRQENYERAIELERASRKRNPRDKAKLKAKGARRRALKRGAEGYHTAEEWLARKAEYGDCCAYCGIHENELAGNESKGQQVLHADHIHPLSKGGTNDISNIVPACGKCNCSKGDKHIGEFLYSKSSNRG